MHAPDIGNLDNVIEAMPNENKCIRIAIKGGSFTL